MHSRLRQPISINIHLFCIAFHSIYHQLSSLLFSSLLLFSCHSSLDTSNSSFNSSLTYFPSSSIFNFVNMSRYSSGVKPGEIPPIYDEIMLARKGQEVRHASSTMPWWNPRYWRKRVWAAIIIVIIVIVIIIVAVAVGKARKNIYPDYTPLSYSLKDTCKCLSSSAWMKRPANHCPDGGESFFDQFNYFTGYDPSKNYLLLQGLQY